MLIVNMKLHCMVLLLVWWTWTAAQDTPAPNSNKKSTAVNPSTNVSSTTASPQNANHTRTATNGTSVGLNETATGTGDKTNVYDQKHKILLVVLSDVNVREFGKGRKDDCATKNPNATSEEQDSKKERNSKTCSSNKIQTTIENEPMRCAESQQISKVVNIQLPIVKPSRLRRPEYYEPIACESIPRDESLLNFAIKDELRPPRQGAQGQAQRYVPDSPRPKEVQASIQAKTRAKGRRSGQKSQTKPKQNYPSYPYALQTQLVNRYLNPYKYLSNYDYADQYDYSAFTNPWQDCSSQDESMTYDDYNDF